MPQYVEVPDGLVEFPDEVTPGQMTVALRDRYMGGPAGKPIFAGDIGIGPNLPHETVAPRFGEPAARAIEAALAPPSPPGPPQMPPGVALSPTPFQAQAAARLAALTAPPPPETLPVGTDIMGAPPTETPVAPIPRVPLAGLTAALGARLPIGQGPIETGTEMGTMPPPGETPTVHPAVAALGKTLALMPAAAAEGLLTPENAALMAGAAAPGVGTVAAPYFGYQMLKGAIEQVPGLVDAIKARDWEAVSQIAPPALVNALMAAGIAKGVGGRATRVATPALEAAAGPARAARVQEATLRSELGLSPDASPEQVQAARAAALREVHPDVAPGLPPEVSQEAVQRLQAPPEHPFISEVADAVTRRLTARGFAPATIPEPIVPTVRGAQVVQREAEGIPAARRLPPVAQTTLEGYTPPTGPVEGGAAAGIPTELPREAWGQAYGVLVDSIRKGAKPTPAFVSNSFGIQKDMAANWLRDAKLEAQVPEGPVGVAEPMPTTAFPKKFNKRVDLLAGRLATGQEVTVPAIRDEFGIGRAQAENYLALAQEQVRTNPRYAAEAQPGPPIQLPPGRPAPPPETVAPTPQYAYRTRAVGEEGIPFEPATHEGKARATLSPQEAEDYAAWRRDFTGKPQEIVRFDTSTLDPKAYRIEPGPQGNDWVVLNGGLPESELERVRSAADLGHLTPEEINHAVSAGTDGDIARVADDDGAVHEIDLAGLEELPAPPEAAAAAEGAQPLEGQEPRPQDRLGQPVQPEVGVAGPPEPVAGGEPAEPAARPPESLPAGGVAEPAFAPGNRVQWTEHGRTVRGTVRGTTPEQAALGRVNVLRDGQSHPWSQRATDLEPSRERTGPLKTNDEERLRRSLPPEVRRGLIQDPILDRVEAIKTSAEARITLDTIRKRTAELEQTGGSRADIQQLRTLQHLVYQKDVSLSGFGEGTRNQAAARLDRYIAAHRALNVEHEKVMTEREVAKSEPIASPGAPEAISPPAEPAAPEPAWKATGRTRRERMEARLAKREEWAAGRQARAEAAFNRTSALADQIPLGQPILVGHHSEAHARADQARIVAGMRAGVESQKMAKYHAEKAKGIENQLNTSIYSDDADAPEQLQAKIADLEAQRDRRKLINAEIRRGPGWEKRLNEADAPLTDLEKRQLTDAAKYGGGSKPGFPAYSFTNLSGNIGRLKARLADIEQQRGPAAPEETGAAPEAPAPEATPPEPPVVGATLAEGSTTKTPAARGNLMGGRSGGAFGAALYGKGGATPERRSANRIPLDQLEASDLTRNARELSNFIHQTLSVASVSDKAQLTADELAKRRAEGKLAVDQADHALRKARWYFDGKAFPTASEILDAKGSPEKVDALIRKYPALDFEDRYFDGKAQPNARMDEWADLLRGIAAAEVKAVREMRPHALQDLVENYLPQRYKNVTRASEHAATISQTRFWGGDTSWRKQRVHQGPREYLEAGLIPKDPNPVTRMLQHVGDVQQFLGRERALKKLHEDGVIVNFWANNEGVLPPTPPGWRRLDPRWGTIGASNEVPIEEFVDKKLHEDLKGFADSIGVNEQRLPGVGGPAGVARYLERDVLTKFGSPMGVLAHEIGHQLDHKYGLWDALTKHEGWGTHPSAKGAWEREGVQVREELRKLADLRAEDQEGGPTGGFKKYVRQRDEKMANLVDAYVNHRDRMASEFPNLYRRFNELIEGNEDLAPLATIHPTLTLGRNKATVGVRGQVTAGYMAAPEAVAKVFERHFSPGISRNPAYRGLRFMANALVQSSLSLSGYHATFTSIDAATSQLAIALSQLGRGAVGEAALSAAKVPIAPVLNVVNGYKFAHAALKGGLLPPDVAEKVGMLMGGAGALKQHTQYLTNARREFLNAARQIIPEARAGHPGVSVERAWSATWRAPFAALETTSWPIMEFLVPNQKLGVFFNLAAEEIARLQQAHADFTPEERDRALRRAWDATEDRLGQLDYGNLNWNRTLTEALFIIGRAPGWNIGSIRAAGGAITDTLATPRRLGAQEIPEAPPTGEGEEPPPRPSDLRDRAVTLRQWYALASVLMVTALGTAIQRLMAGKWPTKLKDLPWPQTGGKTPSGAPERLNTPTYFKDYYSWLTDPIRTLQNKANPFITLVSDIYHNRKFPNQQIYSPDDPAVKRGRDTVRHLFELAKPIGFQNVERLTKNPESKLWPSAPLVGITAAPSYITDSDLVTALKEYARKKVGQEPLTAEQATRLQTKRDLTDRLRAAKTDEGRAKVQGEIAEARRSFALRKVDVTAIHKGETETNLERLYDRPMPIRDALKFYDMGTPEEQEEIKPILRKKAFGTGHGVPAWNFTLSPEKREKIKTRLDVIFPERLEANERTIEGTGE